VKIILKELEEIWNGFDKDSLSEFVELIITHRKEDIIGIGAGRMGYSIQSFIMRLSHLGFKSFMIGDTSLPKINKNSLVIVNSSSGETLSIKILAEKAKEVGAKILTISANENSSIANLSDKLILIPAFDSSQLMKSIYEQFSMLLFDHVIHLIVQELDLDEKWIANNHSILE